MVVKKIVYIAEKCLKDILIKKLGYFLMLKFSKIEFMKRNKKVSAGPVKNCLVLKNCK